MDQSPGHQRVGRSSIRRPARIDDAPGPPPRRKSRGLLRRAGVLLGGLSAVIASTTLLPAAASAQTLGTSFPPISALTPANPAAPALVATPQTNQPDPYAIFDAQLGEYILYTTASGYDHVPAWTAPTMTGPWTYVGDVLPTPPSWTDTSLRIWKPTVADINGTWTLWGTAALAGTNSLCLYRATATSALGPFTVDPNPALSPGAFCSYSAGGDIDPDPVQDRSGTWWLTYKFNGNVTGQPTALESVQLGANGLPTGPTHLLLTSDQPWESGLVESPAFVLDRATGVWWLTFSAGDFGAAKTYQVAAVPCTSMAGPCAEADTVHLVATNTQGPGPGEQSVATEPDGADWLLYNPAGPFTNSALRPLALVRLGFTTAGLPFLGDPTQSYTPSLPTPVVALAPTPSGQGYWLADAQGYLSAHGDAPVFGTMATPVLNQPIVGMVPTPDGAGLWLVASDGGIFTFGDAQFYGSTGAMHLNKPIVGMAATPSGHGYWLVASDGGVFAFGDARFLGSMGSSHLNAPVVGMAADPATGGYWLVASDGGIFTFDAPFAGSRGGAHLNAPIVGMTATPNGQGYWLVASDGGIFTFGSAAFAGSTGALRLNAPIVGMAPASSGRGYWLVAADGGIFAFDAPFFGAG